MRKLIVVIIILTGFMVGINLSRKPNGFRSYQEVLAELINDAPMKTYCDSLRILYSLSGILFKRSSR